MLIFFSEQYIYTYDLFGATGENNLDVNMLNCVYIKNNAWVTVNNDFWVTSEANRITSDPNIVIHGNECIILFLTRCFMSSTHNSAKTIIDRSFRNCRQGRSFLT